MPATELENVQDEQDVLNISDEGDVNAQKPGSDDADTNPQGGDAEDRGDDFVDPEAEDDGGANDNADAAHGGDGSADANPAAESGDGGANQENDDAAPGDDNHSGDGKIPASRLGEVARAKSAATAIADGLVDGSIDPAVIRDFGGAAAAAKAVANRDITIEELQTGITRFNPQQQQSTTTADPNSTANWDLDAKYVEYQELVEAGETKEAASMLRQINKEERARERAAEAQVVEQKTLVSFVNQLIAEYPVLNDPKSPEHESVMVWANHLQATQGIGRVAALEQAIKKVGLSKTTASDNGAQQPGAQSETPQQRTNRLRTEAAIKKSAQAQNQQPPPMGLGATLQGTKQVDISKLSDDDFARLPDSEKAALRGDTL